MNFIENIQFVDIIEFLGTFAFAISGVRMAATKKFDLFGAFTIGFVTAIGGGTLRDLFIGVTPFWMASPVYLWATLLALLFVLLFKTKVVKLKYTFFLFDSIGLGLFVVVGVEKTLAMDFEPWVAIIMGTITGSFGGMLRDVLITEIPLIFRKEIYALACVIGGTIFFVGYSLNMNLMVNEIMTASIVILIRILAVKFHWHLPVLKENKQIKL
ncbi:MAG: trimeric intracellular cation channel family protein [Bacteroidia bacterium]|nr:trimeric intracellular cation channel family protein [Bacteroidia bacterium]